MQIEFFRNATFRFHYHGQLFLMDPFFAARHSLPSFAGRSPNPLVDLPVDPAAIIKDVETVVLSHLHTDHFDPIAQQTLAKDLPVLCQPGDEEVIRSKGFTKVTPVVQVIDWQGISITRTEGQHGVGDVLEQMGQVSGFLFQADDEPTVYWVGDSIWYERVEAVIKAFNPQIIITHSSGAMWGNSPHPIVMDAAQTIQTCMAAPDSTVVAIHMESLDHGTVSRDALRQHADESDIAQNRLLIPADGETLSF